MGTMGKGEVATGRIDITPEAERLLFDGDADRIVGWPRHQADHFTSSRTVSIPMHTYASNNFQNIMILRPQQEERGGGLLHCLNHPSAR